MLVTCLNVRLCTLLAVGLFALSFVSLAGAASFPHGAAAAGSAGCMSPALRAASTTRQAIQMRARPRRRSQLLRRVRTVSSRETQIHAALRERGGSLPSELKALGEDADNTPERAEKRWHYHGSYLYWLQHSGPKDRFSMNVFRQAFAERSKMSSLSDTKSFTGDFRREKWEFLGPRKLPVANRPYHGEGTVSGRVNGVAFDPQNPNVLYLASAGGGF